MDPLEPLLPRPSAPALIAVAPAYRRYLRAHQGAAPIVSNRARAVELRGHPPGCVAGNHLHARNGLALDHDRIGDADRRRVSARVPSAWLLARPRPAPIPGGTMLAAGMPEIAPKTWSRSRRRRSSVWSTSSGRQRAAAEGEATRGCAEICVGGDRRRARVDVVSPNACPCIQRQRATARHGEAAEAGPGRR
jgi:hypothetical protein